MLKQLVGLFWGSCFGLTFGCGCNLVVKMGEVVAAAMIERTPETFQEGNIQGGAHTTKPSFNRCASALLNHRQNELASTLAIRIYGERIS